MQVHVYHINNVSVVGHFSYNMNIVKNNNKISTLINPQNNTDVISRYGYNGNTPVHHVDLMYVHKFTRFFIVVDEWLKRWNCNLEAVWCWWFESYRGQDISVMFTCSVFLAGGLAAFK